MKNIFKIPAAARLVALMLIMLMLSACAGTQGGNDHPAVDRSNERWNAVISGDLEKAYTYYSPGFRSANSLIDFGVSMRTKRVHWTSAEYVDHSCEDARCTIHFDVGFRVLNPVPGLSKYDGSQVVTDTWIKSQGQWWYLPNK